MKFSLATCYLELDKYSEAEKIFSEIAAGQSAYTASAGWYLALSSLKQKDIKTCRNRLQSIPQSSSYYARAAELLRKLPD
jgi:tetratricopeptide (TPR) repeat protein